MTGSILAVAALFATIALAQVQVWGQCGGNGYTGSTSCVSGATCTKLNDWYYQCLPGSSTTTPQKLSTTSTTPGPTIGPTDGPSGKLRYMPFGDSITEFGCWRAMLYQKLRDAGNSNIDFVGSQTSTTQCSGISDYDRNHEGHAGYLAINIANQNQLVQWLQQNPADIITMHLGTNDVANSKSTQQILDAFTTLIKQMRNSNPRMRIIVAQIIPLPMMNQPVIALNQAIPAWAQSQNTTDSPIWLVNQYDGFSSSDLGDGVHPNSSGDTKMAAKWYPVMLQAIASLQGSLKREVSFIS